ncbi:MAG: hypothetical protein NTV63_04820 [Candidatus Woesearchaeota archaeon]|nr:hypothetical protein [Candidatus Woesearchaeota archaeon]
MDKGAFGDLDAIEKREKKEYPHTLEALIEAEEKIKPKILGRYPSYPRETDKYLDVLSLAGEALKKTDYTEKDIENFVLSQSGSGENESEEMFIGIYAGAIVENLGRRKGRKKTIIAIDGKGRKFNYLFHCIRNFGEIYLSNFNGTYICHNAASYGKGEILVLNRVKGNGNGGYAGSKGKIGLAILNETGAVNEFTILRQMINFGYNEKFNIERFVIKEKNVKLSKMAQVFKREIEVPELLEVYKLSEETINGNKPGSLYETTRVQKIKIKSKEKKEINSLTEEMESAEIGEMADIAKRIRELCYEQ